MKVGGIRRLEIPGELMETLGYSRDRSKRFTSEPYKQVAPSAPSLLVVSNRNPVVLAVQGQAVPLCQGPAAAGAGRGARVGLCPGQPDAAGL